ncbi:DUF1989 domain-containing protein [Siminovitchia sediminis]|uniref:DUF1989 domain-containing protein n=1 Tax=Siminovitchia sediminis TaxID=1274353 RepID=A0ABW4KGX8_9BACI
MPGREVLVPGGYGRAFQVTKGECITVIDLEGKQVADLIAFNPNNFDEYLSTAQTRVMLGKIHVTKGDCLYSNFKDPVLEIIEDTVGVHDTIYPCCDRERYLYGFGVKKHRNCRENFVEAFEVYGLKYSHVPGPLNLFQNTPLNEEGTFGSILEPKSKAGDYVILKAHKDLIIGLSACPMDLTPLNGGEITDIKAVITND